MMAEDVNVTLSPRVVLIEDDPLVRLGQEILLRDWGYRVAMGASRNEIDAALRDAPRDVAAIISDFRVDGPETGADIALGIAAAAGQPIPTAIMSASMGRQSGAAATANGFAFFAKPVDPEQLRSWLATAIAQRLGREDQGTVAP
jgi:DNA-binding NtrC family response regulator